MDIATLIGIVKGLGMIGGGIGSAVVERLIQAGARVALHYHNSEERVLQLQNLCDNVDHKLQN